MNEKLPNEFKREMERLLGEEYPLFLESYEDHPHSGLRVNTGKITPEAFPAKVPFSLKPIPWIKNGFTYEEGNPAKDAYYYAGLYYLQEPSAMTPADRLDPKPGDFVLDLCAAPGGKATELGARLQGKGLLMANDISNSRAKALLKNLELFGISNCYVTSENPEKLVKQMPEFFDKILVDAPCSGEGMFRKDPKMISYWNEQGPEYYSNIQKELILQAADMLRPGGRLLYSTCTFSPLENEGTIHWLLQERPQMRLISCEPYEGFSKGRENLDACVRIFPHKMSGEGHFLALLEKEGEAAPRKCVSYSKTKLPKEAEDFLKTCTLPLPKEEIRFLLQKERLYMVGAKDGVPEKLRFLRTGLYLGDCLKNRFEPSQALAMTLSSNAYDSCVNFKHEDDRVVRYLKGETLDISDLEVTRSKGWQLVCVDGFPLGWGKLDRGILKNKYYAGWRWQ